MAENKWVTRVITSISGAMYLFIVNHFFSVIYRGPFIFGPQ